METLIRIIVLVVIVLLLWNIERLLFYNGKHDRY